MALSLDKIPVTLVEDSRLTFPEWSLPARFGGSAMNYAYQTNNGLPSGSGPISFSIRTNDPVGAVVAPTLIWHVKATFTISGVAAGGTAVTSLLNQGYSDAPRAYPFTSCCNNIKLDINGQSVDFPNCDMIGHVLRRFNPRASLYKSANFCPWMPDSGCTNYGDLLGTTRNPLNGGAIGDFDFGRGAYQRVLYTPDATNPKTGGTVVLDSWEPVNLSPFIYEMQGKGIPYIQNIGLTFYLSNVARALCHASVTGAGAIAPIANGNVTVKFDASELYYQQINLPSWARTISPVVKFPFYRIRPNANNVTMDAPTVPAANGVPSTKVKCQSQILSYDCIPSRIYVFVQPDQSVLTMQDADFTFMYVDGLQVTWGNNTYMTSVQPEQLYTAAVDAGYAFPWENFAGSYVIQQAAIAADPPQVVGSSGSIICLRPGIDFPLEVGQTVGMGGSFTFAVQGNFHNQRNGGGAILANTWTVAIMPGVFTISSDGTTQFATGVINRNDAVEAADKETGDIVEGKDIYNSFGSGMFDSLKSSLPLLKRIGRYAQAGLTAAKDAGLLGEGVMSGGSTMSGGAASMYGGARLTAADLAARRR